MGYKFPNRNNSRSYNISQFECMIPLFDHMNK